MAYFIVIGTNDDVKGVVDEVKRAHLQHNVITSGCILREGNALYYQWDVFNEKGVKTTENKESIILRDALTNQISQFKTLLPDDAIPNVFIVSKCFDEAERDILQMVCDELYQIGGATLSGIQVDVILIGYDLNKPDDVTIRPHWRLLESIRGLGEGGHFHTNILYVNNMDYWGAATNVDARVLSRFLCHWSKMVCSGGYDPKATVQSHVYSIGMSEHQYDFRDLNEFFNLSAEERLLDRTLNGSPSSDTQKLLDTNYFKKIDLDTPWLDGLCHIQSSWEEYCTAQWDPSKRVCENVYSVSRQELILASYLNSFLKLYILEEKREIETLKTVIVQNEMEKSSLSERLEELYKLPEDDETRDEQLDSVKEQIAVLEREIEDSKHQIHIHEINIDDNTFIDADDFHHEFGTKALITDEDEADYMVNKEIVDRLIAYVKSEGGIRVMREALERATNLDVLPEPYPLSEVNNMGRVIALDFSPVYTPLPPETETPKNENDKTGCLSWVKRLFRRKESNVESDAASSSDPKMIADETRTFLKDKLSKSVAAMKRAEDVRKWWARLCSIIDLDQKRRSECILLMDGEKDINGNFVAEKEGYCPESHQKSRSLIDMERVRRFRDSDAYYLQMINKFLDRWFDSSIKPEKRMTMPELIKHQVLDPLVGRFHTLRWDGSSPFVKEDISDEEMHEYLEQDLRQSKPFVEYVRIQEINIVANLSIGFFSNNPNIPTDSNEFRNRYNVNAETLNPVRIDDFVNSLCVIQIMDIPDHVDALKDFKPRRDTELNRLRTDIRYVVTSIIGDALSIEEKARRIYNWICENIAYDTTKQIYDAETCYRIRRGVCEAYCELFCYMAEAAGLTADIIVGKTKDASGTISENHSWVFVYTHAYDGIFLDPTWGAGSVDGVSFIKNDDYSEWFNVSPYLMIFSHFPNQRYWSKLDINVTEEQFVKLPPAKKSEGTDARDFFFECFSKLS